MHSMNIHLKFSIQTKVYKYKKIKKYIYNGIYIFHKSNKIFEKLYFTL